MPPPVVTRFALSSVEGQLTTLTRSRIVVSPDGSRLVYNNNGRPFIRNLSEFDAHAISAPGTIVGQTAFSPDGLSLAVWAVTTVRSSAWVLAAAPRETVCRCGNVFGMTWDKSGIITGQGAKGILRCPLDGGAPEQMVNLAEGEEADGPQILPGGDALLFTLARTADGPTRWDSARIVVQSLRSSERKTVVEGGSAGRYVPSGHLVYARGGVVFAVPFDADRREVTGQAVAVVDGVRRALRRAERRRSVRSLQHRAPVLHSRSGQYRNRGAHYRAGGSRGIGDAIDRPSRPVRAHPRVPRRYTPRRRKR